MIPPHIHERFWSRVDKTGECWNWTSYKIGGYGAIKYKGKMYKAHRISYQLAFGKIQSGLFVCHKCDNHKCVRPNHLFLGTAKDNNDDACQKGHHSGPRIACSSERKAKISVSLKGRIRADLIPKSSGMASLTLEQRNELLVLVKMKHKYGFWARTASAYGITPMALRMLAKGANDLPKPQIAEGSAISAVCLVW